MVVRNSVKNFSSTSAVVSTNATGASRESGRKSHSLPERPAKYVKLSYRPLVLTLLSPSSKPWIILEPVSCVRSSPPLIVNKTYKGQYPEDIPPYCVQLAAHSFQNPDWSSVAKS